jgi:hypothetical protein
MEQPGIIHYDIPRIEVYGCKLLAPALGGKSNGVFILR